MKQSVAKLIALVAVTSGLVYVAPDKTEEKPYTAEGVSILPMPLPIPPPPTPDPGTLLDATPKEPASMFDRRAAAKKLSLAERKIEGLSRKVEGLQATVEKTESALEKATAPVKFTGVLMRVHDPGALMAGTSTCVYCMESYKKLLSYGHNWHVGTKHTDHFWIKKSVNPDDPEPIFQVVIDGVIQNELTITGYPGNVNDLIQMNPKLQGYKRKSNPPVPPNEGARI